MIAPETSQPAFSFLSMVKKTTTLPKSSRNKRIDPLTLAKTKILDALKLQRTYVALVVEDKPLPKKGEREVTLWFSKQTEGWFTTIRYGQQAIPFDGGADLLIGKLEDVATFYDAVAQAITAGELDAQITKLQTERSAALAGKKAA
jgi:hypothetical protein